jgi:hypothetical protein
LIDKSERLLGGVHEDDDADLLLLLIWILYRRANRLEADKQEPPGLRFGEPSLL